MTPADDEPDGPAACARRHLRIGWWSLLVFLSLGIAVETLHGFKVGWYLDVSNETRRLMWRLAHAHGTLIAIGHVVFGLSAAALAGWRAGPRELASRCLTAAGILMPLGFLLGGIWTHAGDPGLGVLLVPPGGVCLFVAVLLTARGAATFRRVGE